MLARPERQQRYFKAKAIKYNRKLSLMGEKVLRPKNFTRMMIEGQCLLIFTAIDCLNRKEVNDG